MAVRIEDAGFEIRDMIAWVYGSGFPKSLNIGKAVDKLNGRNTELYNEIGRYIKEKRTEKGYTLEQINKFCNRASIAALWREEAHREKTGEKEVGYVSNDGAFNSDSCGFKKGIVDITKGTSEWEGWGTALKPALEPITVARKPLGENTVAENVLKWGVGGINIDGCRVGLSKNDDTKRATGGHKTSYIGGHIEKNYGIENQADRDLGRFPANFIHDGSEEVLSLFPNSKSTGGRAGHTAAYSGGYKQEYYGDADPGYGDSGSAARFFYCAKSSKRERTMGGKVVNGHPTIKPIALMRYLCKLVTPKGGTVLDPFTGSGTTGIAAKEEGYNFIGIEREPDYVKIAEARIAHV